MKKILSLSMLLLGLSFVSFGQEQAQSTPVKNKELKGKVRKHNGIRKEQRLTAEETAKLRTDRLDKKVNLTDGQRKEVYSLQLKNAQERKKMQVERRELNKRHALKSKEGRQELNKVLTPEQQRVLAENRSKQDKRSDNHRKRSKGNNDELRRDKRNS